MIKNKKLYLIIFTFTMILLRFVCELGSNIPTFIQSSVINEFFVNDTTSYDDGVIKYSIISLLCSSVYIFGLLYKPLADKIGRKTIIIINVIGILIGFLLFRSSINFALYAIGLALINMFMQNDIQMIYVLETVNNSNSAKTFGIIKSFGILGLICIPLLREFVMKNDDTLWRNVFIGPIILSIIVIIFLLIFLKESNVFDKSKEIKHDDKISIKESMKYIMQHKTLRISILAYVFYGLCSMAAYMFVESLMSSNGMSTSDVTKALYIYPIVYAVLSFIAGFIADKFGRKKVVVTCGFNVSLGFLVFILCVINHVNPYIIGFLNGIYLGSYWIMGDYISFLFIENVPTNYRSTVLTGSNFLMMLGMIGGVTLEFILIKLIGLTIASMIIIIPCAIVSALIILFKVKETLGKDLSYIKNED